MTVPIEFRAAAPDDYEFARSVYFEVQKWIIDQLFGWDEARENEKFRRQFKPEETQIILASGQPVGWFWLTEQEQSIELIGIYITSMHQNQGIGTQIVQTILQRARVEGKVVLFSTAKINKSKKLFERLGFYTTHEEDHKYHLRYEPE
jgi:GNAT superfamily N-acetyltransferase